MDNCQELYISTPISGLELTVYSADGKEELGMGDTTDENGSVSYTFDKAGDYQIVAQDTNRGTKQARFAPATAIVHVLDETPALTGVTLNVHEATLDPAEPLTLKVSVTPENASGLTYKWESSDEKVALAKQISQNFNATMDGFMASWESRNKSQDIMSQKQSDATLGYERVYDTETGEIYKATNGFSDVYDGKRYQPVTDDNMYTQPISGYIEKQS